jgi:hypothetical protein
MHHLIAIPSQMYLTAATTRATRGHDQKFQIPFSRIQSHQNSYFPSAIQTWNNLPAVLISVPSTVNPVYKGYSTEPESVQFMNSCP